MSLAWDPNNLDANKRALESAMADEELMREISYLERDLEQKQREIRAEAFAREHAKDIPDYEELKTCYLKTLEELEAQDSCGTVEGHGDERKRCGTFAMAHGEIGKDMPHQPASSGHRVPPAGMFIFWSILGAGIVFLAGYMIARLG